MIFRQTLQHLVGGGGGYISRSTPQNAVNQATETRKPKNSEGRLPDPSFFSDYEYTTVYQVPFLDGPMSDVLKNVHNYKEHCLHMLEQIVTAF